MRNQNPRLVYMNRVKNTTPQLRYDEKESAKKERFNMPVSTDTAPL